MGTSTTLSTPGKSNSGSAPVKEQLLQAGEVVGHCSVIELIAAGGMANVYKVWHEQLEVIRAIKILKPGFSDEARGRLETEAKISANLRHLNIVEIYGMGYWNDIPFLEMEYVDGPSLKELLEKNIRLPVQFSLSVVHCVCTALQFAYNQDMTLYGKVYDGLIHRDIKPANILISSRGVVKLADFGIARPSEVSIHTVGSKVMGTFAYLSPEQLNGEKLDQRSDVYSLGTVLYEMLTGSKTFPQKLLAELVQRKLRGQFIPVGSMGIHLPRQLCCAVEKSLALDRSKRFCDAGEFDAELTATLRKLTPKMPEEILRAYLKNPYSPVLHRKPFLRPGTVFRALSVILGFIAIFSLSLHILPLLKKVAVHWKNQLIVSLIPPQNPVPATAPVPVTGNETSKHTETDRINNGNSRELSINPFDQAIRKFKSGQYQDAIVLFESLDAGPLAPQQKTQRVIRLLEAYMITGRLEDALDLAEREPSKDGLFHLLKSRAAFGKNLLETALESAEEARTSPSRYDPNVQRKASFQIASILHARYFLKPNRNNFQSTHAGWESYISAYCSGNPQDKECLEAQEKLASLE